jgi:lipopolysaccharide export system protein LptC
MAAVPDGGGVSRQAAATVPAPHSGTGGARPPVPAGPVQPPRFSGRSGYSLFVLAMKVLLPALATAMVLLVIAWPQISPNEDRFRIGISSISLEEAESLSMLNPRFDGIDERNRPYSVTADLAVQDKRNDDLVDLELPKADMSMDDGTWVAVMAKSGRYDRKAETVDLTGDVVMFHDEGFEVKTDYARVDLNSGVAEGDHPVQAQGPGGSLESEGFRVEDRGERIFFTGKAHMVMYQ